MHTERANRPFPEHLLSAVFEAQLLIPTNYKL